MDNKIHFRRHQHWKFERKSKLEISEPPKINIQTHFTICTVAQIARKKWKNIYLNVKLHLNTAHKENFENHRKIIMKYCPNHLILLLSTTIYYYLLLSRVEDSIQIKILQVRKYCLQIYFHVTVFPNSYSFLIK